MWIEHIKITTCGDISTLEGGWEAFTDQMLPDLKCAVQQPSSQSSILLHWVIQEDNTPYKAQVT